MDKILIVFRQTIHQHCARFHAKCMKHNDIEPCNVVVEKDKIKGINFGPPQGGHQCHGINSCPELQHLQHVLFLWFLLLAFFLDMLSFLLHPGIYGKQDKKRCGLEKCLIKQHESLTTISYVSIAGCLVFKLKLDCAHIMQKNLKTLHHSCCKDHVSILSSHYGHTFWLQ